VKKAVKHDVEGELTKPSLEALTILAYRGPMTRPELEQIRGVQSSMILRNLMMRGLVEMKEESRLGQPVYTVTLDFLKHLGIAKQSDLPRFETLSAHAAIEDVLSDLESSSESGVESHV
jgi:segregation and condensation protein B